MGNASLGVIDMWMSVKEASEKWHLSMRLIQKYCSDGKIYGASRFQNRWIIPCEAQRPSSESRVKMDTFETTKGQSQNQNQNLLELKNILDQFPYKLNISDANGVMVYANPLFMEGVMDHVQNEAIGQYNIFDEPNLEKWGIKEHISKAFKGEKVITKMLKFPNKELVGIRYEKETAFWNLYIDLTSFPIFDEQHNLIYVVSIFAPSQEHFNRDEIMRAKSFIDENWLEPLTLSKISRHVNLSASQLAKVFKTETGFTLHEYYHDVKMKHVCQLLTRSDLMISEVFSQCGISYNSYHIQQFKLYTGLTPRQYRAHKNNYNM